MSALAILAIVIVAAAIAVPLAFGVSRVCTAWWRHKWQVKPLFRCSGCQRDIYPPIYQSMHYRGKDYCSDCEAKFFMEAAEALRARTK